ncbi:MAG: hypothetical protein DI582_03095 [Azospirillum brasilense]|nr:MAG: hypothetical protein DI582_03095 [Azospirillum brasilense]
MNNTLTKPSWDLVLRVTLCFLVFYALLYFVVCFLNGMTIIELVLGSARMGDYGASTATEGRTWLKFCSELAARVGAAVLLTHLGVPRYRFALLRDGGLYTNFSAILPYWLGPMVILAFVTIGAQFLEPLYHQPIAWLLFHIIIAYLAIHYMMHRSADQTRLRLMEER